MRITAALCWWDEPPELLERCVRGMAEIADRVVAVDGAYRRYPDGAPASPPEQADVIRRTATDVGLECDVIVPTRLWAGQVEKRSATLAWAAAGSDWLVVVDADHIISADREAARYELQRAGPTEDVYAVPFHTPPDPVRPIDLSVATNWHRQIAGTSIENAHIFRALPGLHVERFHWWYAALKNERKVWMWYGDGIDRGDLLPVRRLRSRYDVTHLCLQRDERRMLAGRAFCNDRVKVVAQTGQEDDVPGLPPPVWDYATVPY